MLFESDFTGPVNIGSEEMVSINELAQIIFKIAKKDLSVNNIKGPEGVRGRNSDNTLIEEKLRWKPKYNLVKGLTQTYHWINERVNSSVSVES